MKIAYSFFGDYATIICPFNERSWEESLKDSEVYVNSVSCRSCKYYKKEYKNEDKIECVHPEIRLKKLKKLKDVIKNV